MNIDKAVEAVLREEGKTYIWFGHIDLWSEAYKRAKGRYDHLMRMWDAVRKALSRSKLFKVTGRIRAASWSGREIRHAWYDLIAPQETPR